MLEGPGPGHRGLSMSNPGPVARRIGTLFLRAASPLQNTFQPRYGPGAQIRMASACRNGTSSATHSLKSAAETWIVRKKPAVCKVPALAGGHTVLLVGPRAVGFRALGLENSRVYLTPTTPNLHKRKPTKLDFDFEPSQLPDPPPPGKYQNPEPPQKQKR